jgi:hypothetical protein
MKGPDDQLNRGFTAWKCVQVTGNKKQSACSWKEKFSREMPIVLCPKFKTVLWKQ